MAYFGNGSFVVSTMAGLFGAALSRPDCDDVHSISYCKKTKLVAIACGKLWAIVDTTKDPLPSDMPLHNGKWMESNPHLIHYSSPTDGDTILHKIVKHGTPQDLKAYLDIKGKNDENKIKPGPLLNHDNKTALTIAIENDNHLMCEMLTEAFATWPHMNGMEAFVTDLIGLAEKPGFGDILKCALKAAWRKTDEAPGLVRLKMSNHRFECLPSLYLPIKTSRDSETGDIQTESPKVWIKNNDQDDKTKGNAPDRNGNMLDVSSKIIGLPRFLKKMVCLTKLPSVSHWSHLIQKRWKLQSTLCGNHLVAATTTENCFTIWYCWAHVRWAFSSTCGVCTYRLPIGSVWLVQHLATCEA